MESKSKHSSSSSSKELNNKKKSYKSHHNKDSSDEERERHSDSDRDRSPSPAKRKHSDSDSDERRSRHKSHKKSSSSHHDEKSLKKHKSNDKSKNAMGSSEDQSRAGGGGDVSLSIEETNKLRAKLGLKPLTVTENKQTNKESDEKGPKKYIDKDTNQEFEHMPAINLTEKKEQKTFKEKLEAQKEKRKLLEKLHKTKGIADQVEDEIGDSAQAWLKKLKEKEETQKKAKMLDEMDEQFGNNDFETSRPSKSKQALENKSKYTADHLKGLRVEHDEGVFEEGKEIILTLKDRHILKGKGDELDVDDDEEADVLVNVNIMDDERAAKNVENKKKKKDYNPYDDFDEDGNFREKSILDKYNEELDGIYKKSFKLGKQGTFDASDSKIIERLNQEHKARAVKLDVLGELKQASDYFTPQEMEKFKKPKKIKKVLRKNKMLKADDLLPLPTVSSTSVGSSRVKKEETDDVENGIKKEKEEVVVEKTNNQKKISLKDIDFGFKNKSDSEEGELNDDDDDNDDSDRNESESDVDSDFDENKLKENDDLKKALEEENNALEQLHNVLSKTRNKITQAIVNKNNLVKQEAEEVSEMKNGKNNENGIDFDKIQVEDQNSDALTLDTMSEFCRNLPNGGVSSRNMYDEDEEELDEEEEKKLEEMIKKKRDVENMDSDEEDFKMETGKSDADSDEDTNKPKTSNLDEEGAGILDDEPILDRGLGSCLKLAVNKGYLGKEKEKQNARTKNNIEAKTYYVEEKNYYDIDDKYNRNRDRFSGPLMDFEEKNNYRPDVKLEYIDEKGHSMNEKEAFRYLSHKFHGKGSGKKKTEKRLKKIEEAEAIKKMISTDTPLNTVELMAEKQKRLQQPYIVLSAQKNKQDQITLHKR